MSIAGAALADSPIASVVPNGATALAGRASLLARGFDTAGGSRTDAAQPADCVRFLFDGTAPQGISLTKCCGFASRVPTASARAWLKLYRTLLGKPGMVALAEQKVASKTPHNGISGLTLEPVRNVQGVETLVLGPGQSLIGSSSDCSHILRANGVQPRHCEIRIDAGRATLRALDFRTWLNNGPVRQVEIHVGDRLTVGPLEFRITAAAPAIDDSNDLLRHDVRRQLRTRRWSHRSPSPRCQRQLRGNSRCDRHAAAAEGRRSATRRDGKPIAPTSRRDPIASAVARILGRGPRPEAGPHSRTGIDARAAQCHARLPTCRDSDRQLCHRHAHAGTRLFRISLHRPRSAKRKKRHDSPSGKPGWSEKRPSCKRGPRLWLIPKINLPSG